MGDDFLETALAFHRVRELEGRVRDLEGDLKEAAVSAAEQYWRVRDLEGALRDGISGVENLPIDTAESWLKTEWLPRARAALEADRPAHRAGDRNDGTEPGNNSPFNRQTHHPADRPAASPWARTCLDHGCTRLLHGGEHCGPGRCEVKVADRPADE